MNLFKNIKNPEVLKEIDVYDFLDRVANPDEEVKQKILEARKVYYRDKNRYDIIKGQLPCFTLNFNFNESKRNSNLKSSTGFIYIDIDGTTEINLENNYIYASWLSLSETGRGVLIKVQGLTLENFKDTYTKISELLNVKSDSGASKATQYCINSYDENIYFNEDSETFVCEEIIYKTKKSPKTKITLKKEGDNNELGEKYLRFNNIDEYDFNGEEYIVFYDEKEFISEVVIPRAISHGARNHHINAIAYQIKALQPDISYNNLLHFMLLINKRRCYPHLQENEIIKIVKSIDKLENVSPMLNKERRVLFNPIFKLDRKQKSKVTNEITGKIRKEKTKMKMKKSIDSWEFQTLGKITQVKLANQTGLNIKTIEKYYKEFKLEIKKKNQAEIHPYPIEAWTSI
ncbi:BT4734/BF3469 family protein [Epilithonimonas sp.]|uniref:BT4734/BF3469 family protein n=1 Tax=Epilithonimonas sp. TaxID=2894511 RepID=UPI0028974746|nr:BT4734/BF3469 family protein [Epilithonimonas sp.]